MIHKIQKNIWVGVLASTVLLSAAPATQAADEYAGAGFDCLSAE